MPVETTVNDLWEYIGNGQYRNRINGQVRTQSEFNLRIEDNSVYPENDPVIRDVNGNIIGSDIGGVNDAYQTIMNRPGDQVQSGDFSPIFQSDNQSGLIGADDGSFKFDKLIEKNGKLELHGFQGGKAVTITDRDKILGYTNTNDQLRQLFMPGGMYEWYGGDVIGQKDELPSNEMADYREYADKLNQGIITPEELNEAKMRWPDRFKDAPDPSEIKTDVETPKDILERNRGKTVHDLIMDAVNTGETGNLAELITKFIIGGYGGNADSNTGGGGTGTGTGTGDTGVKDNEPKDDPTDFIDEVVDPVFLDITDDNTYKDDVILNEVAGDNPVPDEEGYKPPKPPPPKPPRPPDPPLPPPEDEVDIIDIPPDPPEPPVLNEDTQDPEDNKVFEWPKINLNFNVPEGLGGGTTISGGSGAAQEVKTHFKPGPSNIGQANFLSPFDVKKIFSNPFEEVKRG